MPLYEYECPKCGRFEVLQKMSDTPVARHECGSKVRKVMSASAFSFKGSGFYITDYKKSSHSPKADPPKADAPPSCDKPKSSECKTCPSNKAA